MRKMIIIALAIIAILVIAGLATSKGQQSFKDGFKAGSSQNK